MNLSCYCLVFPQNFGSLFAFYDTTDSEEVNQSDCRFRDSEDHLRRAQALNYSQQLIGQIG